MSIETSKVLSDCCLKGTKENFSFSDNISFVKGNHLVVIDLCIVGNFGTVP